VVKVTAHLADAEDFDGYNEIYRQFLFRPFPVRTTVQSVIRACPSWRSTCRLLPERPDR
jgi:2-iminobutanoate/2-iminopropanoate deaminase